jgi:hydrogenase maturation protein HypF
MWRALLQDLQQHTAKGLIAARFHKGLSQVLDQCIKVLAEQQDIKHVVLSGGVFQNQHLLSELTHTLQQQGFTVLSHQQVPSNDGGIALGQALIAAARQIKANLKAQ